MLKVEFNPPSSGCCLSGKSYYLLQHLRNRNKVPCCCRGFELLLLISGCCEPGSCLHPPGLTGALILRNLLLPAQTGCHGWSKTALPTAAAQGFHCSVSQDEGSAPSLCQGGCGRGGWARVCCQHGLAAEAKFLWLFVMSYFMACLHMNLLPVTTKPPPVLLFSDFSSLPSLISLSFQISLYRSAGLSSLSLLSAACSSRDFKT